MAPYESHGETLMRDLAGMRVPPSLWCNGTKGPSLLEFPANPCIESSKMLESHMAAVESWLLDSYKISANSGHPVHRGAPREAFVREFLRDHLANSVDIGTGEIIDCKSAPGPPPGEYRNQFDIVVYQARYPKLAFGGGVDAFLVECVVATIEVKSTLDQHGLCTAMLAAKRAKALEKNILKRFELISVSASGVTPGVYDDPPSIWSQPTYKLDRNPPNILSLVVAYDGPAAMTTVHGWLRDLHRDLDLGCPPMGATLSERIGVSAPAVDGVYVLGKGYVHFDNAPVSVLWDRERQEHPTHRWIIFEAPRGSLLHMFVWLTAAISALDGPRLDAIKYLAQAGRGGRHTTGGW